MVARMDPLMVTNIAPLNVDGELYPNGSRLEVDWLVERVGQATLETLVRIKALWPAGEVVEKPNGHDQDRPFFVAPDRATPTTRWMTMDEGDPFQVNNGIRAVGRRNPEAPQTPPVLNVIPDEPSPRFTAEQVEAQRVEVAAEEAAERALAEAMAPPPKTAHLGIDLPPEPAAAAEPAADLPPEPSADELEFDDSVYDLEAMTIPEVKALVESGKLSPVEALELEEAGKDRSTLIGWLEDQAK